jgi:hypothetical protein
MSPRPRGRRPILVEDWVMTGNLFRGLFDDASLFPPASLTMVDAVAGHLRHHSAWYCDMSGPFVCPDTRLGQLSAMLTAAGVAELDLALVLPDGVSSLAPAVDTIFTEPRLRLRAIELPAGNAPAAEVVAALDATPLQGASAFIELPVMHLEAGALKVVAEHGYLVKLRTGGVTATAFPDEATLAGALSLLAAQRQAFKCTAGLHHAVRHRAADTGFEHHGFLNVLLAVGLALRGADDAEVASQLGDQDPARVAAEVAALDPDEAADIRSLFTSFGTCSTDEPLADLVTLGLVSED